MLTTRMCLERSLYSFQRSIWIALAAAAVLQPSSASADPSNIEDIRADARHELTEGRFESASTLYRSLVNLAPRDLQALREGGRAAHAIGDFATAAALLRRAAAITTSPDPELHYLLGEALWVLGRAPEARVAYARARREIGGAPTERLPKLWLAKIYGRFGDRAAADAVYDAMTITSPADPEVALAKAEMHAAAGDWTGAEETIRRFLYVRPLHRRATEILAWITEANGEIARELELRAALASGSTNAQPVRDYGRALERAGDWAAALETYRRAQRLSGGADDRDLEIARRRMDQRMSIEVAAGAIAKSDAAADSVGGFTGVAVPFGRAHHLAMGASYERVFKEGSHGSASELFAALSLRGAATHVFGGAKLGIIELGGDGLGAMQRRPSTAPAAFGGTRRAVGDHVELGVDGELNAVWRETPQAVVEGGHSDSVTSRLWGFGFDRRLVVESGAQLRRLRLRADRPTEQMGEPSSSQVFGWGGVDYVVWRDFGSQAPGQVLDDTLLQPTFLASSVVAAYRHYEVSSTSNTAFSERMVIADRASIDEGSLAIRGAGLAGRLAIEARTGLGYDWARGLWLARGGLALWITTGSDSRLSVSLDLAKESARAIQGERLSGGVAYHVDL